MMMPGFSTAAFPTAAFPAAARSMATRSTAGRSIVARRARSLVRGLLAMSGILLLASCEEGNPLSPDTGSVEVTVEGRPPPQGGYTATLDGNRTRTINQLQTAVVFDDVASGQHQIGLSNIEPGCEAVDNPRVRNLQAGGTIRTTFIVLCEGGT